MSPDRCDVVGTLRAAALFHDIRKDGSVAHTDHAEASADVCHTKMLEYGFAPAEADLAAHLIRNDIIGRFLQGKIDIKKAFSLLLPPTAELKKIFTRGDILQMAVALYKADAGAGKGLQARLFRTTSDGCIVFRDDRDGLHYTGPFFALVEALEREELQALCARSYSGLVIDWDDTVYEKGAMHTGIRRDCIRDLEHGSLVIINTARKADSGQVGKFISFFKTRGFRKKGSVTSILLPIKEA